MTDDNPNRASFEEAKEEEFKIIRKLREIKKLHEIQKQQEAQQETDKKQENVTSTETNDSENLVGLAFSGGGIRSATFGLGVLEALKEKGLLNRIDYLSTVSGGGYIGAWLSANCTRHGIGWLDKPKKEEDWNEWNESVKHLRRYSNYLSPNLSLLSADAWSMVTVWLRNTLLLQLMIIMSIASVLLLPRLLWPVIEIEINAYLRFSILLLFVILVCGIAKNLKQLKLYIETDTKENKAYMVQVFVFVFMLVSLGVSVVLWNLAGKAPSFVNCIGKLFSTENYTLVFFIISYAATVLFMFYSSRGFRIPRDLVLAAIPAAVLLLLFAAILYFIGDWKNFDKEGTSVLAFAWTPPMVAAAFSLAIIVLIGMQGINTYESIREWWSRFAAWFAISGFVWMLVVTIAFYGPLWAEMLYYEGSWKTLSSGWIGTTLAGLLAGKSASTSGISDNSISTKLKEILAKIAPFVFIVGLVIIVSWVSHWVITINSKQPPDFNISRSSLIGKGNPIKDAQHISIQLDNKSPHDRFTLPQECKDKGMTSPECIKLIPEANYSIQDMYYDAGKQEYFDAVELHERTDSYSPKYPVHWKLLANADYVVVLVVWGVCAVCVFLLSWRIDINAFSLNTFYRNRLARCYLGATRKPEERNPHEFTGFDDGDDFELSKLLKDDDNEELSKLLGQGYKPYPQGPFHIVNCALNLGGSSDLSLHTRHSAIFTLSPLYCGSWYIPTNQKGEPEYKKTKEQIGYIPTKEFGGTKYQPWLGQAISVSGAAASPNMGYHTSAPVAFLMTLFNARLGWWFPNPSKSACTDPAPFHSLKYLLYELFGIANEKSEFSAVSDGGHFENLAAIELIKRKCRVIIISDGECDPKLQFEGLASLIRMCEVDNLVKKIDIDVRSIHPESELGWSRSRCAVGEITYKDDSKGRLIYLKASMNGHEDTAVMQYKAAHPDFPHETTGDQFYAEDQFESYRSLGRDITGQLFGKIAIADQSMDEIAIELSTIFSPMLPSQMQFTKHADRLMDIWNQLSKRASLKPLDEKLRSSKVPERPVFYLCSEMIQLMENVYLDLNLEDTWEHEDNKGWMELFKKWATSSKVEATWKQTKDTYSKRFRSFWDRKLI